MNDTDIMQLNDKIIVQDKTHKGFKTKILGGYNKYVDKNGITQLGEVLFEQENQTVLGGALFVLEKIFGVTSPLTVDYTNDIMNIATSGPAITDIYPEQTVVCLFGVGIGGSGDTIGSVQPVNFYEREIMQMIPFRVTSQALSATDQTKYWFKQVQTDGSTAYYLKSFEAAPTIKVLWDDGVNGEDGTAVSSDVYTTTSTTPILTFIEIVLQVSKNDCREWFQINGSTDTARVNSIGLFTGIQGTLGDGTTDYKQVKLFSKLNINNEMLTESKDMDIIYRIYTS